MRGRRRSSVALLTFLVAGGAVACTGGAEGPVEYSGEPRPEPPPADIVDVLEQDPDERFTDLVDLLLAEDAEDASDAQRAANAAVREATAEVADALTGTGPVTIFAPTNDAFDALGLSAAQLKADPANLARLLGLHVVPKDVSFSVPPYVTDGLVDGRTPPDKAGLLIVEEDISLLTTLAGADLVVNGADQVVSVRDVARAVEVVEPDIQAPNGFIQVVDGVLTPPPAAP